MNRGFLKGIFGAEWVMTMVLAIVMFFCGAGSMTAQSGSGSYPWEGKDAVDVGDADALSSALGNDGNKGKVIRLMGVISVEADITSSIDASIDLNGYALNFQDHLYSINVTGGCLNIYDGSGTASSIDVNDDNAKAFSVSDGATLNIYAGVFTGGGKSTAIYNAGAVNVYGGTFSKFKKAIDNVGTLTIEGGNFDGKGSMTGIYNSGTATVSGGTFKTYVMGIYNAGTLKLQDLPTVRTGNDANATADIGLKEGKVITMAGEISSLPEDYVKIKVGQFSYSESGGYSAAGSVPYMLTSGYKDKVKGIHPAMMFQAYDDVPADYENYEVCAKSGSGTDVGEAQVVKVGEYDAAIFIDGSQVDTYDLQFCVDFFPDNTPNAEIKLLRNVDLGSGFVTVDNGSATNPVVIDLNGHLLTGSNNDKVIKVNDGKVLTIRDSGSGGAIVNSSTGFCRSILNDGGTITVEGGSISARYRTVDNSSGMLTVTGGTITGVYNAVYNDGNGTATISSGTFIGATGGDSAIENWGTMSLGCGTAEVKVIADGTSDAVVNRGELTVGKNVTITNSAAAAISTTSNITVDGFPTFDTGTACDISLQQSGDKPAPLIVFTKDPAGFYGNPIKVKIFNNSGKTLPLANEPYTLTSGYAAHVKHGGLKADKDNPQEPGLVFKVLGVADGAYVLLDGGEAVAYAGSLPVAKVEAVGDTRIFKIGTDEGDASTASGALRRAVNYAVGLGVDFKLTMLRDVDLGSTMLEFETSTGSGSNDPEHPGNLTFDLNGCQLSGCGDFLINNNLYSLSVVSSGKVGKMSQYGPNGDCIRNSAKLTVKDVALSASGSTNYCLYNFGTLTIDGAMQFTSADGVADVRLAPGKTLGIGESLNLSAKLKVYVEDATNVPRKLTTGYGKTVRYEATATTPGKVKAPGDVFTVTNIGGNKLAFAGGEAWVVADGTKALVQTGGVVNAYKNENSLASAVEGLTDNATVMLADDVSMGDYYLWFQAPGKSFTLDLGGHEICSSFSYTVNVSDGALLDITDSGVGGCIKNNCANGRPILNDRSDVSIEGGIKLFSVGTYGVCLEINGGTTTFKGLPTFEHGNDFLTDIKLTEGDVISFADGEISLPYEVIFVNYEHEKYGIMTSGYSAHVKYPAGHEKAGNVIDPNEIFYYYAHDAYAGSTRMYLVTVGDGEEVSVGPQKIAVAYVDETGRLHNDLANAGKGGDDDAALAYPLDGTERFLGMSGTDTWYVALPGVKTPGHDIFTYEYPIELKGDVHLVLADGCVMDVGVSDNTGCIHGDATTSLTIYAQSEEDDKGKLSTHPQSDWTAGIRAGSVTINGGDLDLDGNSSRDCYGIYADGGGLTFNGGEIISGQYYGFYAVECGITVNGGNIRALKERDNGYGLFCLTTGGHTIDINGGWVSAEGDKAGIWATKDINIKSVVTAVCTGLIGYAIFSDAGDVNISGGKVTANASYGGSKGICTLNGNVIITAGQVEASGVPYGILAFHDIILSLSESTDFIKSKLYRTDDGEIKIPAGHYLGASDDEDISYLVFGSADAPYVFGVGDNAPLSNINDKTLVKATPIAGSGNYVAYDSSDGDWLLGSGTEALYPTGLKFNKDDNGQYTAEILLTTTPLAGVPQGMPLILAKKNTDDVAWTINLIGTNDNADDGYKPADIESDYTGRGDRLKNFIATDGAKSFAELIGEATGATVSTAEQARDYLVFTLTGDRFVPITFAYDDTPAAGHCLLVVPKINILLHEDIPAATGGCSSGARRISLGGGESAATGVNGVIGVGEAKDDTYFGLDGRRLSGRPSQKGVYILGGSKVVIR